MKLREINVGEIFKTATKEFIVLEHFENGTTALLQKDFWKYARFDDKTSNFAESEICKDLNTNYYKGLAEEIGEENIVEHDVDLTMNTGHKDYGKCKAKISLITEDNFRKYVEILDKYNPEEWWWTATADSRQYPSFVRCVGSDGALDGRICCDDYGGVRPFAIVSSTIEQSEE